MGAYQSNTGYMEVFKSYLKVFKAHIVDVGYHPSLAITLLLEKHNMTSETTIKEKKDRGQHQGKGEIHLTCLFLSGADILRYNQLKR